MPNVFASSHLLRCRKRKGKKKTKGTKKRVVRSCRKSAHSSAELSQLDKPVLKNPAESSDEEAEEDELDDEPYGFKLKSSASFRNHIIQPLGNLLLRDPSSNARNPGLGDLRVLPDEIVLDVLSFLGAQALGILASVSKSFYVFSYHEPLWRNLVLDELQGGFLYSGTWRSTYISAKWPALSSNPTCPSSVLSIRNFFSDYLFQSWLCASLEMKPEWLERDNIQRRRGISVDEFVSSFEEPNKPVLLESCLASWPAMKKWDQDSLISLCGDVKFAVGPVEMKLKDYFQYAERASEERPLYLFDSKFANKVPELGSDYEVPSYFREDLFSLLGEERPDYRWIIIGPAGSGSSFHVDPNSTSAWNAVVKGSKKWVMFPPDVVPPGVHPSADGADVACPVSIIEWFMNFYGACRDWKKRPIECICNAGDVVFVPNGWWHLVINLEDSVAITQNYVSRRNLLNVLDFLKRPNASDLVSGTEDRVNLYDKFSRAIESKFPGLVNQLRQKAEATIAQQKKPTFWESVTDARAGGFEFSF